MERIITIVPSIRSAEHMRLRGLRERFETFCNENRNLEREAEYWIGKTAQEPSINIDKKQLEVAKERFMLYSFGVRLAQHTFPLISLKVGDVTHGIYDEKELGLSLDENPGSGFAFRASDQPGKSQLAVSLQYLIHPDNRIRGRRLKRTISRKIFDGEAMHIILAGVEEYSHLVFYSLATKRKLDEDDNEYIRFKKLSEDKDDKEIVLGTIKELMGAVWVQEVAEHYMPQWVVDLAMVHKQKAFAIRKRERTLGQ